MKRVAFKIPLQTEVATYMKNRMGWPDKFCEHYAEKFWCHYQASGWKLSSGNSVKDWQACFNSQWKVLKFKEDIELLNKLIGSNGQKAPVGEARKEGSDIERLDAFIDRYRACGSRIGFDEFGKFYELMREQKLLRKMTQKEVDDLLKIYNNDKLKCRCAVVMDTLSGYVNNGLRVSDIMEARRRLG